MDILTPEYNVLNNAYSSLGYKHTPASLVIKIKKQLAILNKSTASLSVKVTNLKTNVSYEYASLTSAAKNLNINNRLRRQRYILKSKIFNGIYKLESPASQVSNFDSNYLNHPQLRWEIEVTDLKLNTVTRYTSMLSAARALGIRGTTISNFIRRNQTKPYNQRSWYIQTTIIYWSIIRSKVFNWKPITNCLNSAFIKFRSIPVTVV